MRILFAGWFDPQGAGSLANCVDRVKLLRLLGFGVDVIDVTRYPGERIGSTYRGVTIKPVSFAPLATFDAGYSAMYSWSVNSYSVLYSLRSKFLGSPLLVDEPGDDLEKMSSALKFGMARLVLKQARSISVASQGYGEYLRKEIGVPRDSIHLVRYSVDDAYFVGNAMQPRHTPLIVHTGRVDDFLISVFRRLIEKTPVDIHLVGAAGSASAIPLHERYPSRVRVLPFVHPDKLPSVLGESSLFVVHYPTKFIGQSVKLQHYMSTGRPIVTNKFQAAMEALDSSECVYVEESVDSYVSAITDVLADFDNYRDLGGRARDKAMSLYRVEVVMNQLKLFLAESRVTSF